MPSGAFSSASFSHNRRVLSHTSSDTLGGWIWAWCGSGSNPKAVCGPLILQRCYQSLTWFIPLQSFAEHKLNLACALQQVLALIQPKKALHGCSGTMSDHDGVRSHMPPLQPLSGGDSIGMKARAAHHSRGALGYQVWVSVKWCLGALNSFGAGPFAVPLCSCPPHMSPYPLSPACPPITCAAAIVRVKPAAAPSSGAACNWRCP